MRNTVKLGMVSADKIMLSSTGIGLLDVHETIKEGLSQEDLELYTRAINKVSQGVKLNRKDLKVLDRIDQLTMDVHGICLKDSKATKARIKSAKRYGMQFIDRDGLVDHMNMALGLTDESSEDEAEFDPIMECLNANMCSDCMNKVHQAAFKIANQIALTEDDVWIMQEASSIVFEELGFSFDDSEIGEALIEACDRLGIKYNCHSEINSDSPIRQNAYLYH
ncbi:hypothetical protein C2759_08525 [Polynucleobacter sp. MG-Unter2-18]|uniref:hypothetical protein n=1 Tax=Polynucleobacter sp. MG-Unter2-18 TaxID=2081052 RepID=UPI001BFDAFAB|nr:hypothetical protein [Polynucleobacter sp. MG-Unter2-18]QWD94215.1 hypothetical protein C2759_08525 [Polynucleobacter sp. MG-Unter2-18]